ncbi:MAG TPA: AI-2E family transporter [Chloroflexota bacterium]|nr:AI-2E family transporter [Chloroflexota bacterium]
MDRIRDPWLRALSILLVLIAGLYLAGMVWSLLVQLADILVLFFFAWLVAFMLEPAIALVQERRALPRPLAVTAVYLSLLIVLASIGLWVVPALVSQLMAIAQLWPAYAENLTAQAIQLHQELAAHGFDPYPELWSDPQELARRLASIGPPLLGNAVGLARGAATTLVDLVLVFVLSIYLSLDSRRLTHGAVQAVPARWRDDLVYFMESVRRAFGGFIRGQLVLSSLYGLATALVMYLAGLDFVLATSVFGALMMLIPFLGPILALGPPIVIALLQHPERAWWILVLLSALQIVVLNVVAPRVMSQSVGMHPLLVIAAVLVGAKLAGVWGALFGVPVAGVAVAMASFYRLTVEERRLRAATLPGADGHAPHASAPPEEPTAQRSA